METNNKKSNLHPRTCRTCGTSFLGGPRAWYCPDCREDRKREADRRSSERRRAGIARELGSIDFCVRCGEPYTIEGGLQKYCPDCRPDAIREMDQIQGMEYYHRTKDKNNPIRNVRRQIPPRPCAICGTMIQPRNSRTTCSDECAKEQRRRWQAVGDYKRRDRRKKKKDTDNEKGSQ